MSSTGTVKSYNVSKGFGFIKTSEGLDVFVHFSACGGLAPAVGDVVSFDVEPSPKNGQPCAVNVQGCTGDPNVMTGKGGMSKGVGKGSCTGVVKSYNASKGWGFVALSGQDIFVHIRDCKDGAPQVGDWLQFELEDNGRGDGTMKATHVWGCTGWDEKKFGWDGSAACGAKGKGKGKDKGYGKDKGNGKGKAKGLAAGPYGGGKGKGGSWAVGGKDGGKGLKGPKGAWPGGGDDGWSSSGAAAWAGGVEEAWGVGAEGAWGGSSGKGCVKGAGRGCGSDGSADMSASMMTPMMNMMGGGGQW